jgi:hypothetical protein
MNETPPDPITDEFNPSAWAEPTGLLSKLRTLVHYYVTYPIAQNYPITFTNLVFATDAALTKMANTSYVIANLVPYLASLPPLSITWSAIQNFTGIQTNTINPISGTITIGNIAVDTNVEFATRNGRTVVLHLGDGAGSTGDIHIGNGLGSTNHIQILHAADNGSSGVVNLGNSTSTLNLYSPMTPIRTYPVIPMVSTTGTVAYGTAGTIGYTLVNSTTYGSFFVGGGSTIIETIQSLSIPTGVWYLVGEVICNSTFGTLNGLSFGSTAVPTGSGNPLTAYPPGFFGGDFMVTFSTPSQNNTNLPLGGGAMTISAIYTNTTASPITVRLYFFRPGFGWTGGGKRGYFTATKIA